MGPFAIQTHPSPALLVIVMIVAIVVVVPAVVVLKPAMIAVPVAFEESFPIMVRTDPASARVRRPRPIA